MKRVVAETEPAAGAERLCLDPVTAGRVRRRLRRLSGQVAGIQRMIDEQRGCQEILAQLASVREATNGVAATLVEAHIERCVQESADAGGSGEVAPAMGALLRALLRRG